MKANIIIVVPCFSFPLYYDSCDFTFLNLKIRLIVVIVVVVVVGMTTKSHSNVCVRRLFSKSKEKTTQNNKNMTHAAYQIKYK